ncbi:MAG: alpha/beta fold hydrolase [Bauldia sp.]
MAALLIGIFALALGGCVSVGNEAAAQATADSALAGPPHEPLRIPSTVPGLSMDATLFRPSGAGPFPLVVINHGSEEDFRARAAMAMPSFPALTAWFLARGYAVVVPERPGHGDTGGPYLEEQGACDNPDFAGSGLATADSIGAVVSFMARQPFIKPTGVIVVGNSAGGWGALALASRNPKGVAAVISFAGGRGGHKGNRAGANCAPDRLVAATATYGQTARIPSLWLYAADDTYFPPELSRRMADAYRAAGGNAEYDLLPAIEGEGHGLILMPSAATWAPYLEKFLTRVGR